jgi:cytochrome o ubiquinol oxidase operon protein cyoD
MSDDRTGLDLHELDTAPGDEPAGRSEVAQGALSYLIGLGLARLITVVAFYISGTSLVWRPSIPVALFVLAVAQMGVHLVFFLHITTGPDNMNNVLALAFGVFIVTLLIIGSLWIMSNLSRNMAPMDSAASMQHYASGIVRPAQ